MIFHLSGDHAHDAPESLALLESWDKPVANAPLAMDRAYEGDKMRRLVEDLGMTPVVSPKANRKVKWSCDQQPYKLRNKVERLFRRLKDHRHIYTRFDNLDVVPLGFLSLVFCRNDMRFSVDMASNADSEATD